MLAGYFGAARLSQGRHTLPACRAGWNPEAPRRAAFNTVVGVLGITGLYLAPMYLVGHWYLRAAVCGGIVLVTVLTLYVTWYRDLPEDD
mgnify:CR=1 FL=1